MENNVISCFVSLPNTIFEYNLGNIYVFILVWFFGTDIVAFLALGKRKKSLN